MKPNKRYPITDCALYKIKGKGQLARVLGVDLDKIPELLGDESYRVWLNDKGREIQAPIKWLAHVHRRIAFLMARIELPDYVYSQRGRSHIDNALQHRGDVRLIKTDINSFYPSTTRAMVVKMFLNEFKCAGHVASTLADICCYQQKHLPTGSPLSGYVAFFAARGMFDEISKLASDHDCKMTNIVDDITISGDAADRELLVNVRRVIRVNGLKTRNKKSKVYAAHRPKPVTGAIVSGSSLLLPNRQHLKIKLTRAAIAASTADERPKLEARLKGQLSAAQQVLKHQLGETCCAQNYKNVSST